MLRAFVINPTQAARIFGASHDSKSIAAQPNAAWIVTISRETIATRHSRRVICGPSGQALGKPRFD
jgi:hypothetical protein